MLQKIILIKTSKNSLKDGNINSKKKNQSSISPKKTRKIKIGTDSLINSVNKVRIKNQDNEQDNEQDKDQDEDQDNDQDMVQNKDNDQEKDQDIDKERKDIKINKTKSAKKIRIKNWLRGFCCLLVSEEE